jgi:hypothetical protein
MVRSVLATVAVIVVAVVVALATAGKTSSHGCIYLTIPAATGAQDISECGATARSTCATVRTPGAFTAPAANAIAAECRKARLAVGP